MAVCAPPDAGSGAAGSNCAPDERDAPALGKGGGDDTCARGDGAALAGDGWLSDVFVGALSSGVNATTLVLLNVVVRTACVCRNGLRARDVGNVREVWEGCWDAAREGCWDAAREGCWDAAREECWDATRVFLAGGVLGGVLGHVAAGVLGCCSAGVLGGG
eukprot:364771-Chlamydomonas_euryale.AAC.7